MAMEARRTGVKDGVQQEVVGWHQIGKKQTRPRWKREKLGGEEEGGDYSILAKSKRRDWTPQKFGKGRD